jgi:GTP cyclohydrolase III
MTLRGAFPDSKIHREDPMRKILIISGAALAVAACGSNNDSNQLDTLAVNNLVVDDGMMNAGTTDINTMTTDDLNNMSAADTQNAVQQDLNTNDRDANLANGL